MFPRANFATKDVLFAMKGNVGSKVCPIDKRDDEIVFTKRAFPIHNLHSGHCKHFISNFCKYRIELNPIASSLYRLTDLCPSCCPTSTSTWSCTTGG